MNPVSNLFAIFFVLAIAVSVAPEAAAAPNCNSTGPTGNSCSASGGSCDTFECSGDSCQSDFPTESCSCANPDAGCFCSCRTYDSSDACRQLCPGAQKIPAIPGDGYAGILVVLAYGVLPGAYWVMTRRARNRDPLKARC